MQHSLNEHQTRLCLLGEFCLEFAKTEGCLHISVYRLSGLRDPQFRALFSGLRSEQAMQSIRRLLEVSQAPTERRNAYNDILAHIK